ncbi:MAG: hypothetical protein HQ558_05340 [Candidatus Omnitrophica bacterium]|nr:hypothetical protein [Candidatus Omnitrophota bacterium]
MKTLVIIAVVLIVGVMFFSGTMTAEGADTSSNVVKVLKVDIKSNTQETAFEFKPEDFSSVEIIRHGMRYVPNNYEVKAILDNDKMKEWRKYWMENTGYSMKVMINEQLARDTHVVISPPAFVPLGFSEKEDASEKAAKISSNPQSIDMWGADNAKDTRREQQEISTSKKAATSEGRIAVGSEGITYADY